MRTYYIRFLSVYRFKQSEHVEILKGRSLGLILKSILNRFPKGTNLKIIESKIVTGL